MLASPLRLPACSVAVLATGVHLPSMCMPIGAPGYGCRLHRGVHAVPSTAPVVATVGDILVSVGQSASQPVSVSSESGWGVGWMGGGVGGQAAMTSLLENCCNMCEIRKNS